MKRSEISWTHGTFNPWHGCVKVSPGCANCYAKTFSERNGFTDRGCDGNPGKAGPSLWGFNASRRILSDSYFREPLNWQESIKAGRFRLCECGAVTHRKQIFDKVKKTRAMGGCGRKNCGGRTLEAVTRMNVFSGSMCDIFEARDDTFPAFMRLLNLVRTTAACLTWQLLTKRPENIISQLRRALNETDDIGLAHWLNRWLGVDSKNPDPPENVWLGTSAEDQERADQRVAPLLDVPAVVRFLSVEPMLGPITLQGRVLVPEVPTMRYWPLNGNSSSPHMATAGGPRLHWIICGGESGSGRRPFKPEWAGALADECEAAGVPFFMKQDAGLLPGGQGSIPAELWARKDFPS